MFHDSRDEFYSMEGDSLVFFRVFSKRSIFFFSLLCGEVGPFGGTYRIAGNYFRLS